MYNIRCQIYALHIYNYQRNPAGNKMWNECIAAIISFTGCLFDADFNSLASMGCGNHLNTLRPRQNGRHFPDDIFKYIFLNEKVLILIKISLKFVPKCSINNIPVLVQIMAWRRPRNKPLSEPMMVSFPMHICITRPQWVKRNTFESPLGHNELNASITFNSDRS